MPDSRQVPANLACTLPQQVGSGSTVDLYEPALRTSGLELVANGYQAGIYASSRAAVGQPFGAWANIDILPAETEDPCFFSWQAKERAMIAAVPAAGMPRVLQLCDVPATACVTVSVEDSTGQLITDDVDGPFVLALPTGPRMIFNVQPASLPDVHEARPASATSLLSWRADPVASASLIGRGEDDPALSPDGLMLVFAAPDVNADSDLWVAFRPSLALPFNAPVTIPGVSSSSTDRGPTLAALPGGRLELFFHSNRQAGYRIYRCECTH